MVSQKVKVKGLHSLPPEKFGIQFFSKDFPKSLDSLVPP